MIYFHKMHCCGNDFLIIDARQKKVNLTKDEIRQLADRKRGVGCDQVVIIDEDKASSSATARVKYYNSDGTNGDFCGNATLCLGYLLGKEKDQGSVTVQTDDAVIHVERLSPYRFRIEVPEPIFAWDKIPLSKPCDTLSLPINRQGLKARAVAGVSFGNPHCVIVADPEDRAAWLSHSPKVEHDPLFPNRTNVGIAIVKQRDALDLTIWERGAGFTEACGSGSLAGAAVAMKLGLCDDAITVNLPGGKLNVSWPERKGPISLSGNINYVFAGSISTTIVGSL